MNISITTKEMEWLVSLFENLRDDWNAGLCEDPNDELCKESMEMSHSIMKKISFSRMKQNLKKVANHLNSKIKMVD